MKRSRSVFAVATCLALLGAAACESDPTTSCTFRLSEQVISVPVGESATVDNLSSCRIGDRPPVSWTARRPQIVRVTPTQDLRQARFEGVAVGVDTVDVRFQGNRNIILLVNVTQ